MKKIDIIYIIFEHIKTLRSSASERVSLADFCFFYVLPLVAMAISMFLEVTVVKDAFSVSINFFGIFVALLLNIQVAIFGIFQREWSNETHDNNEEKMKKKDVCCLS